MAGRHVRRRSPMALAALLGVLGLLTIAEAAPAAAQRPAARASVARITIDSSILSSAGGKTRVELSCEAGTCTGEVELSTSVTVRTTTGKKTVTSTETTTLAIGSYRLAKGRSGSFPLSLSPSGKRALAGAARKPVKATLSASVAGGTSVRRAVTVGVAALKDLSPASGPVGTHATIEASGFAADSALSVTVGGVSAPITSGARTTKSGTARLGFTIPAVPAGGEAVVVSDATADRATFAKKFSATSSVSGLSPTSGGAGSSATITASGFSPDVSLSVTVGGVAATVTSGNPTGTNGAATLTFTVPAAALGAESVVVNDPSGHSATSPSSFTLSAGATDLSPTSGPVGTVATIDVSGLAANSSLSLTVGGTTATIDSGATTGAAGSATVEFTIPTIPVGVAQVLVTDATGHALASSTEFEVTPEVTSLSPASGSPGSTPSVLATGFEPDSVLTLTIGGIAQTSANAGIISGGTTTAEGTATIEFNVPSSLSAGTYVIVVNDASGDESTSTTSFTVTGGLTLSPSSLSESTSLTGTAVTVNVTGLTTNAALSITLDGVAPLTTQSGDPYFSTSGTLTTSSTGTASFTFTISSWSGESTGEYEVAVFVTGDETYDATADLDVTS